MYKIMDEYKDYPGEVVYKQGNLPTTFGCGKRFKDKQLQATQEAYERSALDYNNIYHTKRAPDFDMYSQRVNPDYSNIKEKELAKKKKEEKEEAAMKDQALQSMK